MAGNSKRAIIQLESTAGTGYFYVTKKNNRTMTDKLVVKKYDPVARKHVDFKENRNISGENPDFQRAATSTKIL